jgi:copper homeostasis protein
MASAKLEIACFNIESAVIAQNAGADRIELCENYEAGGYSPSVQNIQQAREKIKIPLHVMIRPRPNDFDHPFVLSAPDAFNYPEMEIQWMIQYILLSRLHGVDGVVFGVLTAEKEIDVKICSRLIEVACDRFKNFKNSLSVTFHRAIDECRDIEKSIQLLIDLGVQRVLTSGGKKTALEGMNTIKKLQDRFGDKIIIMPGGSIRSSNIDKIKTSGCIEFHSSAIVHNTGLADAEEVRKLKSLATNFYQ